MNAWLICLLLVLSNTAANIIAEVTFRRSLRHQSPMLLLRTLNESALIILTVLFALILRGSR